MEEEIKIAVEFLKKGKNILYPTDTLWGIGCDATSQRAVSRIFKLKKREEKKSLIVLLDSAEKIGQYVENVPPLAFELMKHYTSPLTIIYPRAKGLAKNVVADDQSIAIRVTRDEFCQKMIAAFGKPIVSTSANISGESAPLAFTKISEEIVRNVDHVVNLKHESMSRPKPSTIIRIKPDGTFDVLRK